MRRYFASLFVLALYLLALGCNGAVTPVAQPAAQATPGSAAPTPTPAAVTSVTAEAATGIPATDAPVATAVPLAALPSLPAPSLFAAGWDERSDFLPGLVSEAQGVLDELPLATVYHIVLSIDESLTALEGQQELRYTNEATIALEELYLRLYPNLMGGAITVSDLLVNGVAVSPGYELAESALRVPLAAPLLPGEQVVLSMNFDVTVPQEGGGHYGTFIFDEEILALAHFYPILAVYDDEGWNLEIPPEGGDLVYSESSFYRVQITAPAGVVLAASGVRTISVEASGRQQVTYLAGPMRDFYVVASPRFERVSRSVGETTLHSYTFPEFMEAGERVLDQAAAAVTIFERYFGPYPFAELDLASTPTLALGVEYPGIVVNALRMYDPENTSYTPLMLESTTAHEVAHQWFYSTVGNDQLDEPWLDEALAQYATWLYFGDVYGEEGYQMFRESLEGRWQRSGAAELPVGLPVAAYKGAEYSAIVYGRGPLFFEAMAEEIGEDAFASFLQDYYQSHQWGIATTESLRAVAETTCSCDLGDLFVEWIYPEE